MSNRFLNIYQDTIQDAVKSDSKRLLEKVPAPAIVPGVSAHAVSPGRSPVGRRRLAIH